MHDQFNRVFDWPLSKKRIWREGGADFESGSADLRGVKSAFGRLIRLSFSHDYHFRRATTLDHFPQTTRMPIVPTTPMSQQRRSRIPEHDWETHKSIIDNLYIKQNRKLEGKDGLMYAMKRDYGFFARCVHDPQRNERFSRFGNEILQSSGRVVPFHLLTPHQAKHSTKRGSRSGVSGNTRTRSIGSP